MCCAVYYKVGETVQVHYYDFVSTHGADWKFTQSALFQLVPLIWGNELGTQETEGFKKDTPIQLYFWSDGGLKVKNNLWTMMDIQDTIQKFQNDSSSLFFHFSFTFHLH